MTEPLPADVGPQAGVDDPSLWPPVADGMTTAELVSFVVPLLEQARARVGQEVVVHIAGGISVDGTLTSVGDDDTLVILDKRRRFDIALQSVAVIEGDR